MSKILIIDDEKELVMLLEDELKAKGHEVLVAYDGEEGIKLIKSQPDLVILDIMMPGMDGFDVCRAIRDDVLCPIVFLSAKQSETDKIKGLNLGGDDYITKPFGLRVVGNNSEISGAVLLSYQIKMSYVENSANWWLTPLMIVTLLSPFIYIIVFTLIFSKVFTNNINKPLQLLMDASQKIKGKNLDFKISYHSENELGRLCDAFSEMKEELKNSLSTQWKMEQERVEMVESLAHDLKTPLSIILGYSEALIGSYTEGDEKLRRYLAIIMENSEKGSKLVQQMQYTSELERSDIPLHLTVIDIPSFIKRKVSYYELQAIEKKIKIAMQIQGEVQKSISTDEEKLERILDNIVSNSLQYTPEGGSIHISVKMEPDNVFYEISDSGIGFSKKDIENVFKKFYRGDEARRSTDGHSGLGLYVSKQLAEQLGGSIKVYNNKTGGACVVFWHKVFNRD